MIQNDVIQSKLRFLQEYLQDLAEYRSITLSAYTASKKDQRFVERTLHLACECCIDIAAHLVSRMSLRAPKDNKDLFNILHENGIISDTVRAAMTKMAQFRNIVVHDYVRIDPEIVIGILHHDMDDLKRFAGEVLGHVAST
jgi:uncharacterized protein YutE (UPF0331/DUF86 family)